MAARRQQQSKRARLERTRMSAGWGLGVSPAVELIKLGGGERSGGSIKSISIVSKEQQQVLKRYLGDLERTTGKLFSLYVCRQQSLELLPRLHETIQINGLGSRGPIIVTMHSPYTSYSGTYPSIAEFDRLVLRPLRTELIQPWIHTGLLEDAVFQPKRTLNLTIRTHGYEDEHATIMGTITFAGSNRQLGTPDDVPSEFRHQLQNINRTFGDAYSFYWVLGLGHCNDLLTYSPINPAPHWTAERKLRLFQQMLFERAIKVDII